MNTTAVDVVQICRAYPILNEKMEAIKQMGYQLLFTNSTWVELEGWDREPRPWFRYVVQKKESQKGKHWNAEQATVAAFEEKYGVKCKWEPVTVDGYSWHCYRVKEIAARRDDSDH